MSGHMKRITAPKAVQINRKQGKFLIKPCPGPHPKNASIPLGILVRDVFGIGKNSKEAKALIKSGKIKVDKSTRKEEKFPVGFMDVVEFGNSHYRITFDKKGRLVPIKIPKKESDLKMGMIIRKMAIKGDKIQITLNDGRNIKLSKTQGRKYKVGSTIIFDLKKKEIIKYIPYEKDAEVFITSGRHVGQKAKVIKVIGEKVLLKAGKDEFETLGDYAFPISKEVSVNE